MTQRFLCRIGLHSWYIDSALIHMAERCNYCQQWRDACAGYNVEAERRRLTEGH